jgi:hypothetical protein
MRGSMRKPSFKPVAMPIWLVCDHPSMIGATGVCYTVTLSLACTFWRADCRPLPTASADLYNLARTSGMAWSRHEIAIRAALTEVCEVLRRYRESAEVTAENQRAFSRAAWAREKQGLPPMPRRLPPPGGKTYAKKLAASLAEPVSARLANLGLPDMAPQPGAAAESQPVRPMTGKGNLRDTRKK